MQSGVPVAATVSRFAAVTHHYAAFGRPVAHSAGAAPVPQLMVSQNGLDPSAATEVPAGPFDVWLIPGARGLCLLAVPTGGYANRTPPGGSCTLSSGQSTATGVWVTTSDNAGQTMVVGAVPNGITGVTVTNSTGATRTVPVTANVYDAPVAGVAAPAMAASSSRARRRSPPAETCARISTVTQATRSMNCRGVGETVSARVELELHSLIDPGDHARKRGVVGHPATDRQERTAVTRPAQQGACSIR